MIARPRNDGETVSDYMEAARRYSRHRFNVHCGDDPWCHESFHVASALSDTERRFVDMETFGVEGILEGKVDIQFLNTGDAYDSTVLYYRGRFRVSSWGDILEIHGE